MKLYCSLSRGLKPLIPSHEGEIRLYMCGITVYDLCHLGHARNQICADIFIRYLEYRKYKVTWVRNITDIDDKIIRAAAEAKTDIYTITSKMIREMYRDFDALNISSPTYEPRATEYVPEMIKMIQDLESKGWAYQKEGDVLFNAKDFPHYGQFRNSSKREDFVLWKSAKHNEPSYDSPWGKGRPGWHIECSAMSNTILGRRFDLHLGGADLIFPHHENEIAQSYAVNSCVPANIWMHIGLLRIEGKKMSKSLKNFVQIRSLLQHYSANSIRFFLLQSHYRHPVSYSLDKLQNSSFAWKKLIHNLLRDPENQEVDPDALAKFQNAMDNDLLTPEVFALLFRLKKLSTQVANNTILVILECLGFTFHTTLKRVDIESLIQERRQLKKSKRFEEADRIRSYLLSHNISLSDLKERTYWHITE